MHLLIRRTRGYYEGKLDLKHVVKDTRTVADVIARWDLKIPYLEFRAELRKISEMSLSQAFETVIPWSDSSAVNALKPGSWVLPLDEDDWLHPELVAHFNKLKLSEKIRFVTWGVLRKEADGAPPKDVKMFVESCGYALRVPSDWKLITNHMHISDQPIREVHHMRPVLAVRNETPASIGYMVQRGSPRVAIETSVRNRKCDQKRLFHWTRPQADAYYQLLERALG